MFSFDIQNCILNKKYDNTSLRVFYEGKKQLYVLRAGMLVIGGILHLTTQNGQNTPLLKDLFMLDQAMSNPIVTPILKATVTRFLKVIYVWASV